MGHRHCPSLVPSLDQEPNEAAVTAWSLEYHYKIFHPIELCHEWIIQTVVHS